MHQIIYYAVSIHNVISPSKRCVRKWTELHFSPSTQKLGLGIWVLILVMIHLTVSTRSLALICGGCLAPYSVCKVRVKTHRYDMNTAWFSLNVKYVLCKLVKSVLSEMLLSVIWNISLSDGSNNVRKNADGSSPQVVCLVVYAQ